MLFVRSIEHLPRAREAANMLLTRRRRNRPSTGGEVLGIFVREQVDEGLVAPGNECPRVDGSGFAFRESAALAGIWSLCWFELPRSVGLSGSDRRRILLDALELHENGYSARPERHGLFLAVWSPAEAQADVNAVLRGLVDRYPALEIGRESFVDHPEGGVVSVAEATQSDNAR